MRPKWLHPGVLALGFLLLAEPGSITAQQADKNRGQDRAEEAKHQADCRLAHQVLTKGRPHVKRAWALNKIVGCPGLGGEALAAELRRFRNAESRTDELERVVLTTSSLTSESIVEAALEVASDPAAGSVARIQAIRVLSYQISPGTLTSYEEFVQPGGVQTIPSVDAISVGDELRPGALELIYRTLSPVADDVSVPEPVRTAARNVAEQAQVEWLCPEGTSEDDCVKSLSQPQPGV